MLDIPMTAPSPEYLYALAGERQQMFREFEGDDCWLLIREAVMDRIEDLRDQLEQVDDDRARGELRGLRDVLAVPKKCIDGAVEVINKYTGE